MFLRKHSTWVGGLFSKSRSFSMYQPTLIKNELWIRWCFRDRLQISLLIFSEFKQINYLLFPLKSSSNPIRLNSFSITRWIWRRSLTSLKFCTETIKDSNHHLIEINRSHYIAIFIKIIQGPEVVSSLHSKGKNGLEIFLLSYTNICNNRTCNFEC